jgi:hypothetical protein
MKSSSAPTSICGASAESEGAAGGRPAKPMWRAKRRCRWPAYHRRRARSFVRLVRVASMSNLLAGCGGSIVLLRPAVASTPAQGDCDSFSRDGESPVALRQARDVRHLPPSCAVILGRVAEHSGRGRAARRSRQGRDSEDRFDRMVRAVYSTDASGDQIVPLGVVFPRTAADIAAAVKTCGRRAADGAGRRHRAGRPVHRTWHRARLLAPSQPRAGNQRRRALGVCRTGLHPR